ncbi:SAM-dependent methyltransferase [Denitratisoma sp. DHT3]|uniref:CheR family methyltransferase n=1 Tax=Denitratisoma sp. DHT3 TaxID=1981880 RepID=UPI0011988961|nr:protein-glutamate O-methyltransferase CheR [Denitratisoma sp. DHT3]QDX80580.1 SAM-dependent methyltransferase [Denitratisoma sp. DHT3]
MLNSPEITDAEFAQFQKLIYKIAGISMSDAKKILLVGRLSKRLRHYNFSSYGQYYRLVTSGTADQELQLMVDLLTTNETYFFREGKHFDFLRNVAAAHPAGRPFNVWSAAASTGEEIYTICMVLADVLGIDGNWTVTGSDINLSVLKTAEAGHYVLDRTRGLPPEYLRKYCLKGVREQEGTFLIDKRLRDHTRFLQVNLNNQLPELGPFEVIFLRNVMIYFDQETKRRVVGRLIQKLRPGGCFIVGHSETLNGINDEVRAVHPTIYRKP